MTVDTESNLRKLLIIPAAIADDEPHSELCGREEVVDVREELQPVHLPELDILGALLRPNYDPDEPPNNDCDDDDEQPKTQFKREYYYHKIELRVI